MQKNFGMALKKVKLSLARVFAMAKERDALAAKYKKLCSSVKLRVGFVNNKKARFKAEIVKMTQERDVIVGRREQLPLEVQCFPWLMEEAKKLRERL